MNFFLRSIVTISVAFVARPALRTAEELQDVDGHSPGERIVVFSPAVL